MITIWNEYRSERTPDNPAAELYPEGIHTVLSSAFAQARLDHRTAYLDQPEYGLPDPVLENTDVLFWWGYLAHDEIPDALVDRIQERVLGGMGLVLLHSSHHAKVFKRMLGTSGSLTYRVRGEKERLWVVNPGHPIAAGLGAFVELPQAEMYGEPFDIPQPDELVFVSWFEGGEVFRSGCCWQRGRGRIFYFRPGHEAFPIYHNAQVQQILINAARWATPAGPIEPPVTSRRDDALE
ncbi:MAG: trehalose utilization protein ThuA [Chloroflexi bacterium]|nr:trehalose utilization protein ThuA [Chloroflexota bacterium]